MALFLVYLFLVHYLADFVCQTNWMALNKSKSHVALAAHVLTYSAVLLAGLLVYKGPQPGVLYLVLVNGALHYVTDAITSRISSYFFKNEMRNYFWWTIGFDQFLHQATLILLVAWLLP